MARPPSTIQYGTLGTSNFDLTSVTLGGTDGQPTASCGNSGSVQCVECLSGGDCSGGQFCDGGGSCVECLNAGHCDDAEACTTDSCNAGSCVNDGAANNGQACNDGLFCTATDTCNAGTCAGTVDPCPGTECADTCFDSPGTGGTGGSVDCTNLNTKCANGTCNASKGSCFTDPLAATTPGSDGAFCNGAETCDATLGCVSESPLNCEHLDDECNFGVCSDEGSDCMQSALLDGTSCTLDDECVPMPAYEPRSVVYRSAAATRRLYPTHCSHSGLVYY